MLQDVSAESSLKWPELYRPGLRRELTTPLTLSLSLLYAVYASLVYFFIPCRVFCNTAFDYQTMAVTVAMSAMFTATTEVRTTRLTHNNIITNTCNVILFKKDCYSGCGTFLSVLSVCEGFFHFHQTVWRL